MVVEFNTEIIRLITLFENLSKVNVKDCLVDKETNTVFFVVNEKEAGLAIGKNGRKIKEIEKILNKNIKIFEFSKDLVSFVKNLIPSSAEIRVINENERVIVEVRVEKSLKPVVIGRDKRNLKIYKEFLKRLHKVDDLIIR